MCACMHRARTRACTRTHTHNTHTHTQLIINLLKHAYMFILQITFRTRSYNTFLLLLGLWWYIIIIVFHYAISFCSCSPWFSFCSPISSSSCSSCFLFLLHLPHRKDDKSLQGTLPLSFPFLVCYLKYRSSARTNFILA